MTNSNENGSDISVKKILQDFMAKQLNEVQEENNSYLFLEKGSLNMLLSYFMLNEKKTTAIEPIEYYQSLCNELDEMAEENKQNFEHLIAQLKAK